MRAILTTPSFSTAWQEVTLDQLSAAAARKPSHLHVDHGLWSVYAIEAPEGFRVVAYWDRHTQYDRRTHNRVEFLRDIDEVVSFVLLDLRPRAGGEPVPQI